MIRARTTNQQPPAERLDIAHGGEVIRVMLRRVSGARRYTLRVRAATRDVLLTMPKRGSLTEARDFAQRHAAWIGARVRRLPERVPFEEGATIPILGVEHRIAHAGARRGGVWTEQTADGQTLLMVAGERAHMHRRVLDFLKARARAELEGAARRHAATLGRAPKRITVRDTSSRWGSCSATGCLSFSWRLILAPAVVLDYLAAHEVAHLVHLDHSAKFWALARRLAPETDRAEAWLSAHGATLHRYGQSEPD